MIGTWRPGIDVIAVGSHDTASAVVAVPATEQDFAYISCGTWGLVGVELPEPVLTDEARAANFTNEGGVDGRVRFLHNVMGLWLLNETLAEWGVEGPAQTEGDPGCGGPGHRAGEPLRPQRSFIRAARGDAGTHRGVAAEHELPVPATRAELVRCIVDSLAAAFAEAVADASRLSGKRVSVIHVVGGGSQNALLCQLTADRSGLPVLAGPVEATALGNVLVQGRALGAVQGSLEHLRALVARTHPPLRYEPTS